MESLHDQIGRNGCSRVGIKHMLDLERELYIVDVGDREMWSIAKKHSDAVNKEIKYCEDYYYQAYELFEHREVWLDHRKLLYILKHGTLLE